MSENLLDMQSAAQLVDCTYSTFIQGYKKRGIFPMYFYGRPFFDGRDSKLYQWRDELIELRAKKLARRVEAE